MNSKLHPAIAALVIALAVLALALWIWARGQARELGGPAQLLVGPSGHLYVQINDQLLEHGANGEFLRRHDLSGPAASELVGGIGFLANGDLLLRRAANNRSLFARLRAFGRTTSTSPPARDTPGTGLCRYRLEDSTCRPFGAQGLDPGAAFGLVIDPASGDVYLSDTSRHVLRKYASDGKPLAGPVGGFRFPNGLALVDGKLYVADTNMHRVAIVDPRNDSFGDLIGTRDVVPDAARVAGQRWPTRIVRVGDAWWVNNMNTALEYGGIYVFDDDWHYRRRVELPPGADPIDLLPYRGEVLISDWYNDRVYRVSAAGTLLGRFSSTGIDALLGAYRHERLRYGLLSYAGVAVLAMVFLVLIVHALVAGSALGAAGAGGAEPRRETATGTDPCWLYPDQRALVRVRRRMRAAIAALLLVGSIAIAKVIVDTGRPAAALLVLPVIALALMLYFIGRVIARFGNTAVCVDDGELILRDIHGRESRAPLRDVTYSASAIATPQGAVFLGRQGLCVYDVSALASELMPRLGAARKVSEWRMQRHMAAVNRPPPAIVALLIAAGVIVGTVVLLYATRAESMTDLLMLLR